MPSLGVDPLDVEGVVECSLGVFDVEGFAD